MAGVRLRALDWGECVACANSGPWQLGVGGGCDHEGLGLAERRWQVRGSGPWTWGEKVVGVRFRALDWRREGDGCKFEGSGLGKRRWQV